MWQKYLVEAYNDSTIIRTLWENYGIEYAGGNSVSLFPIYNDAIKQVTNNEIELSKLKDLGKSREHYEQLAETLTKDVSQQGI